MIKESTKNDKFVFYRGGSSTGLNVPYFAIAIAGVNFTPIPPRFINSISITRYKDNAPGKFTIQLTGPVHVFEAYSEDLNMILTYLAQKVDSEGVKDGDLSILYGWAHGDLISISSAVISSFDVNISYDSFISYTIAGEVNKVDYANFIQAKDVFTRLINSTDTTSATYSLNFLSKDKSFSEVADVVSTIGITTDYQWEMYLNSNSEETINKTFNLINKQVDKEEYNKTMSSILAKYSQLSFFIEDIIKIAFPDYEPVVDHSDRDYSKIDSSNEKITLANISAITQTALKNDYANKSIYEYLKGLVAICKEYKENTNPNIKNSSSSNISNAVYYEETTGKYAIFVNGDYYVLSNDPLTKKPYGSNNKNIYSTYDPYGSTISSTPFSNLNIIGAETYTEKVKVGDETKPVTYLRINTDNNGTKTNYALTKVDDTSRFRRVSMGENGENYEMYIDTAYKKIYVRPKDNSTVVSTYVISNNVKNSQVVKFSIGFNGLKWIAADAKLESASAASIDVNSGLSLVSTSDLNGAIGLDQINMKALQDAFLSKMSEFASSNATTATLSLVGSSQASAYQVGTSKIRVYPLINNSPTFWCGDYTIMKITDTIDENGFITELELEFSQSVYDQLINNKISTHNVSEGPVINAINTSNKDTIEAI